MNFKIGQFIQNAKIVRVYTYVICDDEGNELQQPAFDFIMGVKEQSERDAQILVSQLQDMAHKYGIQGRKEASKYREGLWALPSKYEEGKKVSNRYRLFFWIFDAKTIILGGGCHKPATLDGKTIKAYQEVFECEHAAAELSKVANHIELLKKKHEIDIYEIETDEILSL